MPPTRLWIKAQPKLLPLAATLWCRWTISRISMATRSFPLTTIRSPTDGLAQQAQFQQPPTPTQPAQPQPQTQPQQPATGAGQPGVNGPATGNSPSGSGGGAGVGNAGIDPSNPTWAQGWSPEFAAFDGFSNPTPTQPLTDDQLALIRQKIVESSTEAQIGSTALGLPRRCKGEFPRRQEQMQFVRI